MKMELCKRHNVDHTGTWCGLCVLLWKKKAAKWDKVPKKIKEKLKEKSK